MATISIFNSLPEAILQGKMSEPGREYRIELHGGDVTMSVDGGIKGGYVLNRYVDPVERIGNARWVISGNTWTLMGSNVGWGTTDRWVTIPSVTAKYGVLVSGLEGDKQIVLMGYIPIPNHVLLDPPEGDGSLGIQFNASGILRVTLSHV